MKYTPEMSNNVLFYIFSLSEKNIYNVYIFNICAYVYLIGWWDVINQTSFVDVSVEGTTATTIVGSTTSIPLLESRTTVLIPTSESVSEAEESSDSSVPSNPPSMFSTSMTPPRPTPSGQEEELITTVAPTIKEEHEDTDITGQEPQHTTESSEPVEEPDDHSVTEISTIQPDVPMPDTSVRTEPMFVVGKTDKTILDSGVTATMASHLTTVKSNELSSEEVFSSAEPTSSTTGLHSTTPFPDYDEIVHGIQTNIAVEGMPPTQPPQEELSSSPLDSTSITDGTTVPTAIPTDTTFMCNTQPGRQVEMTSKGPPEFPQTTPQTQDLAVQTDKQEQTKSAAVTATTDVIDSETSAEDVTSSISVFDESTIQMVEHSSETLTEDDITTEIGTEFFTSPPMASSVADMTSRPGTAVSDQSVAGTTAMHLQSLSGKAYKQYLKPLKLCLKYFIFNQNNSNLNAMCEQKLYIA